MQIAFGKLATADFVEQEIDPDPALCGAQHVLLESMPQRVVAHDEELDQHVVASGVDAGEQAVERRLAVDQQLGLIAAGQRHHGQLLHGSDIGVAGIGQERLQPLPIAGENSPQHGIALAAGGNVAVEARASEDPVGRYRQVGKGDERDDPGHGPLRGATGKECQDRRHEAQQMYHEYRQAEKPGCHDLSL